MTTNNVICAEVPLVWLSDVMGYQHSDYTLCLTASTMIVRRTSPFPYNVHLKCVKCVDSVITLFREDISSSVNTSVL
jgi:hypothetical protein